MELQKGMRDSLEILEYVNEICKDNDIKYTLLYTSLLAVEEETVPEWLNIIQIGIFYDEYIILIDKLLEYNDVFYVVNHKTDPTFREFFSRVYKRSGISLPEGRNNDKRFYDSFINVFPIYEVADTDKEYQKVVKKYNFYRRCISTRASVKGVPFKFNQIKRYVQHYYYLKNRTEDIVIKANDYLCSIHKAGSKYVLIPGHGELQKGNRESALYKQIEYCLLGKTKTMCLQNKAYWIEHYWTDKHIEKIKGSSPNIVLQRGMGTLRRVQLIALDILIEFDRICRKHDIKYILAAGTLLGAVRHKGFIPWDDDVDVFMLYEEWLKFEKVYMDEIDDEKFFVRTQKTDVDNNLCFFQIKRNGTIYCKEGRREFNSHPGIPLDILPYFNSAPNYLLHRIQDKECKFWKTVTWAHMGAQSEKKCCKRKIYTFYQNKFSNKEAFGKFIEVANRYKANNYLTYVYTKRNPYRQGSNLRKYFEDLIEIEFEGRMFWAPKDYDELLRYAYTDDYLMFPQVNHQINQHLPAHLEIGDLHSEVE